MIKLKFTRDDETRNTVRFEEVLGDRERGIVGRIYLHKPFDHDLGSPQELAVTIESVEASPS